MRVAVRRDGFAPAEVRGAAPLLRVALRPEATLFFRVVDDATEAPRSGLQVRARNRVPVHERPAPEAEGTTLEDGTCRIRGLRPGAWSISVAETGWHLGDVDATEPTVPPVELRLRRPFTLRGRVVVPGFDRFVAEGSVAMGHGAPVLRGLASDGTIPATIGADGRFALLLDGPPKSPYFMRVETGGQAYRVQGQTPAVDPGTGEQVGEIQVPLPGNNPDIAFSGTVRDESGRPVQGALVLLGSGLPFQAVRWMRSEISLDEAWTDAAGAWRALPRYSPTVYREALVLHPHFAPRLVEIPTRMRRKVVDAVLERGVTAIVTVRDAAGRPVVGAEVAAKMAHSDPEKAWQHFGGVQGAICAWPRTGEDGVAALEHLGTGHWYLSARSADGREGATVLAEVRSSGKDFAVDLRLAPLPVVRGTVRVRGGSLPAGATLFVPGETLLSFVRVPIDGSGMFESPPLDIPACFLVDGKIPIFEPEIAGPGRVLALAEPGVPVEIVVDPPPAAPQAR